MISDNATRYGSVSRLLHWLMAIIFGVQFLSALSHYAFEDSAFEAMFMPWHKPLGFTLLMLVAVRIVWALIQRSQRPPMVSNAARLGHLALYALMLVVPTLALLRQYGSGRSFEPFGLPLMAGFDGPKIDWMVDLGSLLHGELGWLMLLLILGHIIMTVVHRRRGGDEDVLPRMWGSQR